MNNREAIAKIEARKSGTLFFEEYTFSAGKFEPLPAHSHPEYQIGLAVDSCGRYVYRGNRLMVPRMTLNIIHSGVTHKPDKEYFLEQPRRYRMLYISPADILAAAREIGWRKSDELPYFSDFVIDRAPLVKKYINLFKCFDPAPNKLTVDVNQMDFLTLLVKYFSQVKDSIKKLKSDQPAIKEAREYLDANFTKQISLNKLAQVANISKYHLCRKFRETIGVSPHVYQNQLRLNQAKKLLAQRESLADVAHELGFYDQSHFGRYFKSFSGVTPRMYSQTAIFS